MGTYNALLHTCVRTREIGSGRRLLGRMVQEGVPPDGDTFRHQCSLHIMQREHALAFRCLDTCRDADVVPPGEMCASRHISPHLPTPPHASPRLRTPAHRYVALINVLLRGGRRDEAQEMLEEMEKIHPVSDRLRNRVNSPDDYGYGGYGQHNRRDGGGWEGPRGEGRGE